MTIKNTIKELRAKGYRVSYRKRSDGGYLITSINGQKYAGATGNTRARSIVGTTLSTARAYQLARIRPSKVAKTPIPEAMKKELRKVQRLWRKNMNHPTISGSISTKNLRYQIETFGVDVAWEKLSKAKRRAQGYAYEENINWLKDRILDYVNKIELYDDAVFDFTGFDEIISLLENPLIIENFKEEWIAPLNDILYDLMKLGGLIDQNAVNSAVHQMLKIIK